MSKIILLTGEKQSGKTTLLYQKFSQSNHAGGVLMPVLEGRRHFYSLSYKNVWIAESIHETNPILRVGRFSFLSSAFDIANQSIHNDIGQKPIIILDEIGPLELVQGLGLKPSLDECLQRISSIRYLILVVRPSLVDNLKDYCYTLSGKKEKISITSLDSSDCEDVS